MPTPLTKIVITLPSQDTLKDIWKVFDYIIIRMEELGRNGMPLVDVMGRKKFRAEVMKAPDGTVLDVFRRWVTILVPELVPVTPSLLQQIAAPPSPKFTEDKVAEDKKLDAAASHVAEVKARRIAALAVARSRRGKVPKGVMLPPVKFVPAECARYEEMARGAEKKEAGIAPKKNHHKKKVEGV